MDSQFKDFRDDFNKLREEYRSKKISEDEYKSRLKSLQLKDRKGRSWTIGAQSGKWYCYDGHQWVEEKPPTLQDKKAICIYCGCENDLENEVCINCGGSVGGGRKTCSQCGETWDGDSGKCPHCEEKPKTDSLQQEYENLVLKGPHFFLIAFDPRSMFFFLGGLGGLFGIMLGAFAGTTNFFPGVEKILPLFLSRLQGGLFGGIIYSLMGGVLGFLAMGASGILLALMMNLVISVFGPLKIRVKRSD